MWPSSFLLLVLHLASATASSSVAGSHVLSATSSSASASTSSSAYVRPLGTRAHHGLSSTGMQINSIYFGVLPDWSKESPIDINKALGKSIAIIGDYIYVSPLTTTGDPFSQISAHSSSVVKQKSESVYAPAIIFTGNVSQWTDTLTQQLVSECQSLNEQGVTVWLRWLYEFNGSWMSYGLQPEAYQTTFRSVATAVKASCNQTYMLWSPNVAGGDVHDDTGYTSYYPGQQYVDIVGLSFYYTGWNKTNNTVPDDSEFQSGFDSFYKLYGSTHPVVISETSAPFRYELPSCYTSNGPDTDVYDVPVLSTLTAVPPSSPNETLIKSAWLEQLLGQNTAGRYPNLTAVSWFNYFKENSQSQFSDYRAIGGQESVETVFRNYVGNVTAYQGGFTGHATRSSWTWLHMCIAFITILWTLL